MDKVYKCHSSGLLARLPSILALHKQRVRAEIGLFATIKWRDIMLLFRGTHTSSFWRSFRHKRQNRRQKCERGRDVYEAA